MRKITPVDIIQFEQKEDGFLYLGTRCELFRTNCGISRAQMAAAINVSQQSIFYFETTGRIRGKTLGNFLEVLYYKLAVNPAYILFENNENIKPFVSPDDTTPEHIISLSKDNHRLKTKNAELVAEKKSLENLNKALNEKLELLEKQMSFYL